MRPDGLRLFWSMPPRGERSRADLRREASGDWLNLELAGVSGVMLPLWLAWREPWIVHELAGGGWKVILRVLDEDLQVAAAEVAIIARQCPVELVIIRNEPDAPYNLRWGGDWGNRPGGAAERFRDDLALATRLFSGQGVAMGSGALSCRDFREDDPPQPGLMEWAHIMRPAANEMGVNCVHAYTYNWLSDVDRISIKNRLQLMAGLHHQALALTELGVKSTRHTQVEKARAYLEVLRWLCDPGFGPSERYVMAIPFVSTGSEEWRAAGYVLDEVEVYRLLGEFVG